MFEAKQSLNRAIEIAFIFALPAAVALIVIANPVITVLFQRGAFGATESSAAAGALVAYAGGLPAFVLIKVLAPAYFARQDIKTPVLIAVVCLVANIILNVILMGPMAHIGIALATTLSGWLNVSLLAMGLTRRGFFVPDFRLRQHLSRVLLSSAAMGGSLYGVNYGINTLCLEHSGWKVGCLVVLVITGIAVYATIARLTGLFTFEQVRQIMRR